MRAIVACGWYGIQTWFGGQMIYTLLGVALGYTAGGPPLGGEQIAWLGINGAQFACFMAFWAIQFWYIVHGMDAIRKLETYTAPLKIAICFVLLGWVYNKAGGFGPILDQPSQFAAGGPKAGQFWTAFWPSLTAMVGFWATLALNIPDFTRFAKTQRDQIVRPEASACRCRWACWPRWPSSSPRPRSSCTARRSGTRSTWPAA